MADTSWIVNPMLAERNRLAKALNKKILKLERAGVTWGAIQKYKDFIEEYYGPSRYGNLRFPEKRTATSAKKWNRGISLRRELDMLEFFMYQPKLPQERKWKTMDPKEALAHMDRTRAAFASMGLTFPNDSVMREFLESESWRTLKKQYGSKLAIRLAGTREYREKRSGRRSSVQVMDQRLARFMKRRGEGYDIKDTPPSEIMRIFGLHAESLADYLKAESEDDLPL